MAWLVAILTADRRLKPSRCARCHDMPLNALACFSVTACASNILFKHDTVLELLRSQKVTRVRSSSAVVSFSVPSSDCSASARRCINPSRPDEILLPPEVAVPFETETIHLPMFPTQIAHLLLEAVLILRDLKTASRFFCRRNSLCHPRL